MPKVNYKLYLVTDSAIVAPRDFFETVEQALKGGVTLLQLREKHKSSREFYQTAVKIKGLTKKYNVPLIINDRLDIALAVDADGVHVGQKDLPVEICRKHLPDKLIGVSASNYQDAVDGYKAGADYIGLGAVFPTSSKDDAVVVTDDINQILKDLPIPVVGIGGINQNNCRALIKQGFAGVAVISAILGEQNVRQAAKNLLSQLSV